jgi:hypothetical protein
MKAPSTKLQAPEKLQAPSNNAQPNAALEFGVWNFSGAWGLELAASFVKGGSL